MLTWRFFCHVEFKSLRLEFHRRKRRIWRRSKEIEEDEEKNPRRKKKNRRTYGNRKNTKRKRTYRRTWRRTQAWRWKEPTEEEPWKTKQKNGPGEHKKSSFKYLIFTWIFFHIRLPLHATQVIETRVPPLNSSFRVSRY